ncbi:ATP-dependent DNA helicase PIF1-like, partial [Aphis craccivora]
MCLPIDELAILSINLSESIQISFSIDISINGLRCSWCKEDQSLQVKAMRKKVIEALVITECARGCIVIIKRITLIQTDYPFETIIDHSRDWLERRMFFTWIVLCHMYKKNLDFHLRLLMPGQRRVGQLAIYINRAPP